MNIPKKRFPHIGFLGSKDPLVPQILSNIAPPCFITLAQILERGKELGPRSDHGGGCRSSAFRPKYFRRFKSLQPWQGHSGKQFFMAELDKIQVLFSSRSENIVKRLELRKVRMDFVASRVSLFTSGSHTTLGILPSKNKKTCFWFSRGFREDFASKIFS